MAIDAAVIKELIETGSVPIAGVMSVLALYFRYRSIQAHAARKKVEADATAKIEASKAEAERRNAESQAIVLRATMDAQSAINIGEQLKTQTEIIREALRRQSDDSHRLGDQREQDTVFVAAKLESNTGAITAIKTDIEGVHSKLDALPIKIAQAFNPATDTLLAIKSVLTLLVDDVQRLSVKIEDRQKSQTPPEMSKDRDL